MKYWWLGIAITVVGVIAALILHLRPPSDGLEERLLAEDTGAWISIQDPERAAPGYTLAMYKRRLPFLMDMAGRVVHSWPEVRVVGRARLSHEGHLLVISAKDEIDEYDWDGRLLFRYTLPEGDRPHHDLIWLRNGNPLILAQSIVTHGPGPARQDYLLEVDREGATVWRWDFIDHAHRFPAWDHEAGNPTHTNSVHELAENPVFAAGDQRFRPGNLLVSGRNLSTIFVIDKVSGEVVWQFSEGLDFQHEALMLPAGHPHAGQVLLFNNGLGDRVSYRRSRVQIYDPRTFEKTWEYSAPFFFSSVGGLAQPLWNGNLLVVSSRGGRAFELTSDGDTVWQWEPSYNPMRPIRYPRDHCPQLAALDWALPRATTRATPFVDESLYDFALPTQATIHMPGRAGKAALVESQACRQLILPPDATLRIAYGLRREALGGNPFAARFVAELRNKESGHTTRVLDAEVRSDQEDLVGNLEVSLADLAYAITDLCLDAQTVAGIEKVNSREAAFWMEPTIHTGSRSDPDNESELTQAERDLRLRQLRSIGYIQ